MSLDNNQPKLKIILVGNGGSGKSSLLTRLVEDIYQNQAATVGVDLRFKEVIVSQEEDEDTPTNKNIFEASENKSIRLSLAIWDTAGQERFRTITRSYYQGANGAILCYDITNRKSFTDIKYWKEEIERYQKYKYPIWIVGCKSDRYYERNVTSFDIKRYQDFECEVSAINDNSIILEEKFAPFFLECYQQHRAWRQGNKDKPKMIRTESVILDDTPEKEGCCLIS